MTDYGRVSEMDEHLASKVGMQVRRARRGRDWTQDELAEAAGVAPGTVNRIENGRSVRPGNLRTVLDALDIPPLSEQPTEVENGVQLALDIVQKWLEAKPEDERDHAVQDLIRFTVLGDS